MSVNEVKIRLTDIVFIENCKFLVSDIRRC